MKSTSKTKRITVHKNGGAKASSKLLAVKGAETVATVIRPLTAAGLKDVLWETLNDIKTEQMLPGRGDAIAGQAREILRTVKTQLQIAGQAKRQIPEEIIKFSEGK
jgi:hypothetical protein